MKMRLMMNVAKTRKQKFIAQGFKALKMIFIDF